MEREIEFRGKNLKGEWLYGDLVHNRGKVYIAPLKIENPFASADDFEVNEETVGQFTNVRDKDGKKIYEGDILGGCNGSINCQEWVQEPFEVKFKGNQYSAPIDWGTYGVDDSTHYLLIMGNIYDNKNLLLRTE
jgi:hypothetical protein